jgi:flavodoxin
MKNKSKVLRVLLILALVFAGWIALSFFAEPTQRPPRNFPAPTSQFDFGKVLVVYYSFGGNTAEVAVRIRDMTGGSLFEIETEKTYPSSPAIYIVSGLELKNNNFPALKGIVNDFSSYDTIFIGAPVWWYTVATPVLSFLSKADFEGKTVIPFVTDGGNYGNSFVHFERDARNANVVQGINFRSVSKTDVSVLDQKISTWLEELKKVLVNDQGGVLPENNTTDDVLPENSIYGEI